MTTAFVIQQINTGKFYGPDGHWHSEYPDADIFTTTAPAIRAIQEEEVDPGIPVQIVRDYGMADCSVVYTRRPKQADYLRYLKTKDR